jgi:deoxyribodipyrimidine photolyase-related protein
MNSLTLILGNQLFDYKYYKNLAQQVFMCEDHELCSHFKYHKHKIIHFLASMREYRDYLLSKGKEVHYVELSQKAQFCQKLEACIIKNKIQQIDLYEVEDIFFEERLFELFKKLQLKVNYLPSPMFMCSRAEFKTYLTKTKKPFLNSFYQQMRKRHQILMNVDNKPIGGDWTYDLENRNKIPKKFEVDQFIPPALHSEHIDAVKRLVEKYFSDHPGDVANYWIPTNRKDSITWFKQFLKQRFEYFGVYQDAIDERAPFLYHSVISPMMNIGFLLPHEVISEVEKQLSDENLNAVEGFIRQVLGWREFVRGIYYNFDSIQQQSNFFNHQRKLTDAWYQGNTGIEVLDFSLKKSIEWGYCHHIERLMVIGNFMMLLEVHPQEVYRWFMEMYVDSSDWVMGANVFGMSQFSDGGIFATKPYICGSNYLIKMSHFKKGEWCDAVDGLYWQFIDRHRDFFKTNHRMSMMVASVDKMDPKRKKQIYTAADELKKRLTIG